jgi:hypothetical protein
MNTHSYWPAMSFLALALVGDVAGGGGLEGHAVAGGHLHRGGQVGLRERCHGGAMPLAQAVSMRAMVPPSAALVKRESWGGS